MKSLFVSFLALPAAAVLESVVMQLTSARAIPAGKSGAIICDSRSHSGLAKDDAGGHHRYYGRSAYP